MNAVTLVQRLHQHRAWVNQNLLAAAANLNDQELRREFPLGQGSVWKSLLHLFAAEYVWLEALLGNENPVTPGDLPGRIPGNQQGPDAIGSLDQLRTLWGELQNRWERYLAELTPASLDDLVFKVISVGPGQRFATRRSDILLHVCTHAQYTAAQVVNMLRHLGQQSLPATMLIALARQEASQTTP